MHEWRTSARTDESTDPDHPHTAFESSNAVHSLRLLLVDDHPVLRAGLRALLSEQSDFDVVAEAESGETGVALARDLLPDVVLLDVTLPGMSGAEATRCLKRETPQTRVLALSVHDELAVVRGVFDAGADGYLLKSSACDELLRAVRQVAAGMTYLDAALPTVISQSLTRHRASATLKVVRLSRREAEVAKLLAQGLALKEIAQRLSLSPRTLESYRARAMEKLELKSRADLIRYAIRHGWLVAD